MELTQIAAPHHVDLLRGVVVEPISSNFRELKLLEEMMAVQREVPKPYSNNTAETDNHITLEKDFSPLTMQERYHFTFPKFFSARPKNGCFTERTPLLKTSAEANGFMAVHNTDFTTDDDSWENSSAEFEQRSQLGSEMASLSRSSSEKCEMLDSFHVRFNLSKM
ncbi:hypothetical protein JRQ81_019182, partial [Phrynocephalus forsythii]